MRATLSGRILNRFLPLILLAGLSLSMVAHADQWPSKPIRLIVPFPPGQAADIVSRLIAQRLSPALNQSVIVENRPGAGSMLGTQYVARAEPDGYTILAAGSSALAINPYLYSKLSYNPSTDFAPIIDLVSIEYMLCASARSNVKTVADLIKLARAEPGKITYGSSGNGSTNQLAMSAFAAMNHLQMVHVPYKGAAASANDLLSGQIDTLIETVAVLSPFIHSGKIHVLGMAGIKRSPLLPDVPTLDEQGVKGYDFGTWTGLVAPAGTPAAILDRLNAEVAKVLRDPTVRKDIEGIGMIPMGGSRKQFADYIASESKKWGNVVKASGTHLD